MAVKANNEEASAKTVTAEENKKNNLFAIAVGLAGASILLSAGTAFATVSHDGVRDDRGGFSHSQQGSQGGQGGMMGHKDMKGSEIMSQQDSQGGQHRERGEKGPHQNGMSELNESEDSSQVGSHGGKDMPMMQLDSTNGGNK